MVKRGKVKVETPEEQKKRNLASAKKDIERSIELGIIPLNPTRFFNINDRVHLGAHEEVYIRENGENNLYYVCEAIGVKRDPRSEGHNEFHVAPWFELFPYGQVKDTKFTREEKYRIRQYNSGIDSLLHMVYAGHAGVDFDAEYQREHVWTLEDKVALIESIFNNIDIGKFVFVQRHESTPGKYYQIVDGKQRLTALCEFYEDRFSYKGVYFSQLSFHDKYKFTNHSVSYGFLENPDTRGIYETFIKMNTCGKPMDHKHIDKVKKLLNELS
jgi:hypothetical protein